MCHEAIGVMYLTGLGAFPRHSRATVAGVEMTSKGFHGERSCVKAKFQCCQVERPTSSRAFSAPVVVEHEFEGRNVTIRISSATVNRITPGSQGCETVPEVPGSQTAYSQPRGTRTTPRSSAAGCDRSCSRGGLLRLTFLGGLLSGQVPSTLHDLSPHRTSASAYNAWIN
jgi:hypothetical protein